MRNSSEPAAVTAETLSGVEAFSALPSDDRARIAEKCRGFRYSANQLVVSHKDTHTDIYFIVGGEVRATFYSLSGKEVSFRDLGPGDSFGELAAIDGKPRSAYVITLADAFIVSMSADAYWDTIRRFNPVAEMTLKRLTHLVRLLSDRVVEFSTLGVKNRIHAELLRLAKEHETRDNMAAITPAPKHADIASRVSTHREAVTRELNILIRTGLLEKAGGKLLVRDIERLSDMVEKVIGNAT
jgi:CRP-like cAMP-binding protein